MRLAVMGLIAVIGLSQVVFASDEWSVAEVAKSGTINKDGYYVYLKKAEDKWSVVGFSTIDEGLVFGEIKDLFSSRENSSRVKTISEFLDKNDGYERLLVNDLTKTLYVVPNYLYSDPHNQYMPIPMSSDMSTNLCNVGWSNNRTGRMDWSEKAYTFCNSGFTKCNDEKANKLKAAFMGALVLGMASRCQVVVDASKINQLSVAEFESKRLAWMQALVGYQADQQTKQQVKQEARVQQNRENAEKYHQQELSREQRNRQLFEKGQESIASKSLGDMICFDGQTRNEAVTVSAFIEDVNKNKVKVRVNGMTGNNAFTVLSGEVPIDGVVYRNGDVTWSDAKKWRACSL